MKAMRVVTVVCWLIAAAALIGLAVWFFTGTIFGFRSDRLESGRWGLDFSTMFNIDDFESLSGPYEEAGTYNVPASGINTVNIDWVAGNVRIEPYDGADIRITEYAQRRLDDNEKLRYSTSGNTLTIRFRERNVNIGRMPQKRLDVLVPRSLSQTMAGLSVESISGGISVDNISATVVKTDSTSGAINVSNVASQTLTANSMSGSITMSAASADRIEIDSTSGSITATSVDTGVLAVKSMSGSVRVSVSSARDLSCETTSGSIGLAGAFNTMKINSISGRVTVDNTQENARIEADTTSGSQDLTGSFDRLDINSISGSVSIKSYIIPSSLKIDTISGSIAIGIPDGTSVTVNHSSVSGSFSSDIPAVMQNGGAQFVISTISGRTRITKLG